MNEFNLNFYKGKKVLVTGHTGFKGTWLCRILQELGAEVTRIFSEATDRSINIHADRSGKSDPFCDRRHS